MPVFEPLRDAWEARPFQGQSPEDAKVYFFGRDANYNPNITPEFLNILRQYHANGVAYWRSNWHINHNNDHHPFLLPYSNQGAGYTYHATFKQIDLPADRCAEAVSFIELLNVPTSRIKTVEFCQYLQSSIEGGHIARLQSAIFNGRNKLVFMPDIVINILEEINGLFDMLDYRRVRADSLPIIYNNPARNITVRKYLHLSSIHYHPQRVLAQLPVIRELVLAFLDGLDT